jgi:hypothetical protein
MFSRTISVAALMAGAATAPAFAQEAQADNVTYAATFFAEFNPQSALDIVQRTPGFSLDEGSNVRGFGGAAGNVLIDGARPSVKGGGLRAYLERIPAEQVLEVRLIRNAQTAEAQGQAVILDIIRRPVETSLAWDLHAERSGEGPVVAFGSATLAGAALGFEGSLEVAYEVDDTPVRTMRSYSSPGGALLEHWAETRTERFEIFRIAGDARRPVAGGTLSLTGSASVETFVFDRDSSIYLGRRPSGAPDRFAPFLSNDDEWNAEFGVDYGRVLGGFDLKVIGLISAGSEEVLDRNEQRNGAGLLVETALAAQARDRLEAIGRSTVGFSPFADWTIEVGAEVAYNKRDTALLLTEDDGSGPIVIALPGANTLVEETRGDVFLTFAYQPSGRISIDGALAAEASEISVSGGATNSQSFTFFKPSVQVSYDLGGGMLMRLSARREVGQLNFGDFAASAQIGDDQSAAGNPGLGPDSSWRFGLDFDWRRDNGFALTLEAFYEDRQDVLEEILLPTGGSGVGNAGSATGQGIELNLDLPLDPFIPGATLTLFGGAWEATYFDPLIQQERASSNWGSPYGELAFRHDPPGQPFSWGFSVDGAYSETSVYIDEYDARRDSPRIAAYAETSAIDGLKVRLDVRGAGTNRFQRQRLRFDPDRAGVLTRIEDRRATIGATVELTVSGRF